MCKIVPQSGEATAPAVPEVDSELSPRRFQRMTRNAYLAALALLLPASAALAAGPVPTGAKFRATSCPSCSQNVPTAAGLPSGEFLIAWEGESATDPKGVDGRLFKTNGTPRAADFLINKGVLVPDQFDVAVAGDATGYLAAWSAVDGNNSDVFVQRYTTAGLAQG